MKSRCNMHCISFPVALYGLLWAHPKGWCVVLIGTSTHILSEWVKQPYGLLLLSWYSLHVERVYIYICRESIESRWNGRWNEMR